MRNSTDSEWRPVGRVEDLEATGRLCVCVDEKQIGIFRTEKGLFAIDDLCPHGLARLSSGYLEDGVIECPLHNASFSLASGECVFGGLRKIETYGVCVDDDGRVLINVHASRIPLAERPERQRGEENER